MPVISIIVPVYKVEPYLRRCVDSILNQTFQDFELILVDDGSPDGCPAICDEYAIRDSRVRVIHQENGGLSAARNAGLGIAEGEYILFCDSDDHVSRDWCSTMISAVNDSHDNYIFGSILSCTEGEMLPENIPYAGEPAKEPVSCFFTRHVNSSIGFAWNVLYYTDVLRRLNLCFRKDIIIEDLPFCLAYLKEMQSLTYCPSACYYYMQRQEATLSRKYHQDGFRKWQEKYAMLYNFIEEKLPEEEKMETTELLADFYLYFFLDSLNNTFDSRSTLSWRQKLCYNQKAVRSKEFQHCLMHSKGTNENPKYLALLKKKNYYAAYFFVCAAKLKARLKK